MKSLNAIAIGVGLTLLFGCHSDDDDSDDSSGGSEIGTPGAAGTAGSGELIPGDTSGGFEVVFADGFSGGFPGGNWLIEEGSPNVTVAEGNQAPALNFGPVSGPIRVRSAIVFFGSDAFTVSFDLSMPILTSEDARFEFRLEPEGAAADAAAIEVRLADGTVRAQIQDVEHITEFFGAGAGFHTLTFTVTDRRVASWSINGATVMTKADFPETAFRFDLRSIDEGTARFIVDNVNLIRP